MKQQDEEQKTKKIEDITAALESLQKELKNLTIVENQQNGQTAFPENSTDRGPPDNSRL